jgi:signal transduction histidine kinase
MSKPPEPPLKNARVLIVDDTAADRKLLRLKLQEQGIEVLEAGDGVEALDLLRRQDVNAVISDILMPRLDGYRLCAQIRRDLRLTELRFVLHTSSYTSPADEKLAYRFGADAFLRKPAAVEEIVRAIRDPSRRAAPTAEGPPDTGELEVLHQYSDALVRKLEQKNTELEETSRRLQALNQELVERTQQLEQAKAELQRLNEDLENRVRERTAQLETANRELEQFSGALAHDLRSPIRMIQGYGAILAAECIETLTEECKDYLRRIPPSAKRMSDLVDDLLRLSRVNRASLRRRRLDLSALAASVVEDLRRDDPGREIEVTIADGLFAECDEALVRIALENLVGNAWKFTAHSREARIEIGGIPADEPVFFVRDNGAGFDMAFAPKLFTAFNRLHDETEFPGTGIGLATVKRIVERHGGRIWAEAAVGRGATFSFTLP